MSPNFKRNFRRLLLDQLLPDTAEVDLPPLEAIRVTQTMRMTPRSSAVPLHRRWIADIVHLGRTPIRFGTDLLANVAAAARTAQQPPPLVSIWVIEVDRLVREIEAALNNEVVAELRMK